MSKQLPCPVELRVRPDPPLEFNSTDAIDQRVRRQTASNLLVDAMVNLEPRLVETFNRSQLAELGDLFVERLRQDAHLKRKERADVST